MCKPGTRRQDGLSISFLACQHHILFPSDSDSNYLLTCVSLNSSSTFSPCKLCWELVVGDKSVCTVGMPFSFGHFFLLMTSRLADVTAYKSGAADIVMLMLFLWCKSVIMWDVLIFQWKLLCILSSCFGFLTCIDKPGFCVTQHSDTCSLTAEPHVQTNKQIRATETSTLFLQFCLLYLLKFRSSRAWFLVTISCSCRSLKPCFLQAFSCRLPFYIQWFNVVL